METQPQPQPQPQPQLSKVSRDTLENAVTALTKWKAKISETKKAQLLPTDEFIYLVVTLNKIPQKGRTNAYKLPLPHPIYTPGDAHQVCLIIDDKHVPSKEAKQRVLDEGLLVDKVLKLSKLRTDYKAFESKRKLCDSYDMFFADKRVVPMLPKLIGKEFFRKKKVPVPVELGGKKSWKEKIMRVCSMGLMYVGTGSCSVVKVGRVSMSEEEIVENLVAAVEGVEELVGRKFGGLRSLCVKFADSVALPVFQRVPEFRMKIESGIGGGVEEGESEKKKGGKGKKKEVVVSEKKKGKKGRIHEVRYMDSVEGEEMIGGDEEGEEDEEEKSEVEEMGSEEVSGKKRKARNEVKKGAKVAVEDVAVSEDEEDDDDERSEIEEMDSDESAEKKRKTMSKEKKGSKQVKKVKEGVKGLKEKKEKGSAKAKSGSLKKSKRSRVAV